MLLMLMIFKIAGRGKESGLPLSPTPPPLMNIGLYHIFEFVLILLKRRIPEAVFFEW